MPTMTAKCALTARKVHFRSAREALAAGIGMVHQELSTIPDLTVAENVFLGHQPLTKMGTVDWARINKEAKRLIASLGLDIDPKTRMGSLPVGLQQLVELSRVLFSGARIIILDEPTSALSPPEVKRLFDVLRKIKADGRGIIFISHFLDDVLEISDTVTVFRNGKKVVTEAAATLTKDAVISHMIGRGSIDMHMGESADLTGDDSKPVVLAAEAIGDGKQLRDVSLKLRAGEITGVYGFMGCGQIELARALFGKIRIKQGRFLLDGSQKSFKSTAAARGEGIAFVPESRRMMLFRTEPVYKNISIAILDRIHRLLLKPQRRAGHRRHAGQGFADQAAQPQHDAGLALGRQPAEGGAGQMADPSSQGAHPLGADARHGCGRQGRRDPHRQGPARQGRCHPGAFNRTGNHPDAGRPRERVAQGAGCKRIQQRAQSTRPTFWRRHRGSGHEHD